MTGCNLQMFFAPEDESDYSSALIAKFPEVVFVDGPLQVGSTPKLRVSICDCETDWVLVWNRAIYPSWPMKEVAAGIVQGPDLLDIHRSRMYQYSPSENTAIEVLTSGSIGWGGGDPRLEGQAEMQAFARVSQAIAEAMHTDILVPVGYRLEQLPPGGVPGYTIGPAAARWCRSEEGRALKVSAGRHLYTTYPGPMGAVAPSTSPRSGPSTAHN